MCWSIVLLGGYIIVALILAPGHFTIFNLYVNDIVLELDDAFGNCLNGLPNQ